MITTFYPPFNFGGDGIYIFRLCNELARRGHRVDVVHCEDAYRITENKGPRGDYKNHANVRVTRLKSPFGMLSPFLTQQTGRPFFKSGQIQNLIAENTYDVIHYHNMSLIGLQTLEIGDAIKLYTMHEHWLVCPMHVLWKFNREPCTKRDCISCQIIGRRPVQLWRFTKMMQKYLSHVDCFISPSVFTKAKHQELGFTGPINHIPYFLPTYENKEFEVDASLVEPERSFFLFVGRLEKIKGVQNLIPVFRNYKKCDLLIAGDGEYEHTLKRLARDVKNIHFLGRLPYQKLQRLYQTARAVLVPSICYEVFGIVIIEAFTKRTPVIVNNLGALPEVVEACNGGFVYNNENELVDYMEQLRTDHDLRRRLGENGHQSYLRYWSEDYHIRKYLELIESIADRKAKTISAIENEDAPAKELR